MRCLKCNKESNYVFCEKCVPISDEIMRFGYNGKIYNVYLNRIPLFDILKVKLFKQKVVMWWLGTSSWLLVTYPKYRKKIPVFFCSIKKMVTQNNKYLLGKASCFTNGMH